jgi:Flp pilus assembly protein TadD
LSEAASAFEIALQHCPDHPETRFNLALAQQKLGYFDDAAANYERALPLSQAINNIAHLGSLFKDQAELGKAIRCYRIAIQHRPDFAKVHYNLGVALAELGKTPDALASYQEAVRLAPYDAQALNNIGCIFYEKGCLTDAMASFDSAITVRPDYTDAHFNRAMALLKQGDFKQGWAEYEWRWQRDDFQPHAIHAPRWEGSPLDGRTILLQAEQGLGDAIQFLRYAPLVKQRGGIVLVQCQAEFCSLAVTCAGIDQVVALGADQPPFDVHAPLMSLPHILGTRLSAIPADVPYVAVDPQSFQRWRQRFGSEPRFKVGLVWQGNPRQWNPQYKAADRSRSAPLAQFAPLAKVPHVVLYSLQFGAGREQLLTANLPVIDLADGFDPGSMMELAAAILNLDLLITVDTAPAHLAGALGVPTWIALAQPACWRWLLDRSDTPWYPTARLFRQERAGDWSTVFEQMAVALKELTS